MQALPSDAELEAHGLFDVTLDLPSTTAPSMAVLRSSSFNLSGLPNSEWIEGWARYEPNDEYPLVNERVNDGPVRFFFCPQGDPTASAHFRRQSQVKALDTVPYTLKRGASSGSSSASTPSETASFPRRYRPPSEFLAWWEDDLGLWFVLDGVPLVLKPFLTAWHEIVGESWPRHGLGDEDEPAPSPHPQPTAWEDACDLLLHVVECIQALHDRNLSLNWCHPTCFALIGDRVVVNRLWDVTALPGLALSHSLTPALSSSLLFARDPIDLATCHLSEGYVFRHLRYLAPEAAISRRVTGSNDIYGWGVLAYELVTGSTIDGGPDSPDLADVDVLADIHRHVTTNIIPPSIYLERVAELGATKADYPPCQLSEIIMLALAKDPEDRYHSLDALAYDLRKLSQICRTSGDLSKFTVGEVDRMSRFNLPQTVIERTAELEALDASFNAVAEGALSSRVVNVWGQSGYGKSRLVDDWASNIELSDHGGRCLVGRAKSDEHLKKPLLSFVQIFQSLLDRVLTDPREDAKEWHRMIRATLGNQWPFFVSLLSQDYRRLIGDDATTRLDTLDWENFLGAFRSWARRFLQLFACPGRPLILIIDDTQWLSADELTIWRHVLDAQPINNVLVVSMTRTTKPESPPPAELLSASSLSVGIKRLTEEGVAKFIKTCVNGRVASSSEATANFLGGETYGSPLFLRTLMTTLVKENVVSFDYDSLQWRFDLVALQSHLSDEGFDSYVENLMRRLPGDVQTLLMVLSCLPSAGFPLPLLASALDKSVAQTEGLVQVATAMGAVSSRNGSVRFTHDRQRNAAHRLIPESETGMMHQRVSMFLRQPDLLADYLFDAVEHALTARDLGTPGEASFEIVSLLLDATQRAALSASFSAAQNFVGHAEQIIQETGGYDRWMVAQRLLTFRFLRLSTEIAGVFHEHDLAFEKLEAVKYMCRTTAEEINIVTLYVRQLIAANQHLAAVERVMDTLDRFGYNPVAPQAVTLWRPTSVAEVEEFSNSLRDEPVDDTDERELLMTLLSFAGPTIYVTRPQERRAIFILGVSLAKVVGKIHESTAYLCGVHSITISEAHIQYALIRLCKRLIALRPTSFLSSSALVTIGAQAHCFVPLTQVTDEMDAAFEASFSMGAYEIASYLIAIDLGVRLFAKIPCPWDVIARRYELLKPYNTPASRVLMHSPLQYAECLHRPNHSGQPWELEGVFVTPGDVESITGLAMHLAIIEVFSLRLKILYDAPMEEQLRSMHVARQKAVAIEGLVYGAEMQWLMAITAIRSGTEPDLVCTAREALSRYTDYSPDYRARIAFLDTLENLLRDPLSSLSAIEAKIDSFEADGQHLLAGLMNFYTADALSARTGSLKLAAGFARAAFSCYRSAEAFGLCDMLCRRFPVSFSILSFSGKSPSEAFNKDAVPPPLRRPSLSPSSDTLNSSMLSRDETHGESSIVAGESLDTLTLMRSSLALAQEKDSLVLLCTLLRILCQFTRCDYAAIGLCDDDDKTTLRLKAAGPFQRIVSYDLNVSDDSAQSICPATVMLHVARTGIALTKPSKISRLRKDPFYGQRQPRTLLCLPIINQGVQSGVILLLSISSASSAVQSESAREVVSTLATFAYIIYTHHTFARRLKAEVTQRTRELSSALQTKTQFLSQCSHELRSPLAAIMGLAAVLEASPGLSPVQKEHLRTITSSGHDLLSLISNILDHSKLESNSVLLERIPFSIREVVEAALNTSAPVAQSKNIELSLNSPFSTDPPGLVGDPFRVKQVLLNLLSNAIKFTPPGDRTMSSARVTVNWSWEEVETDRIKMILDVSDQGVGIPATKLHKLFKSFSQVDESITRSYGGSGLGLVISRDLARLLGGDCVAESDFGKGSTFTFSFIAPRDPEWNPPKIRRHKNPQASLVICPLGRPWVDLLEEELKEFNCKPVRFTEDVSLSLVADHPNGLNSKLLFAFILIDTSLIEKDTISKMKELQPNARFVFLVRAVDLGNEMTRLQIPRESIIARPIKFQSLYEVMIPHHSVEGQIEKDSNHARRKRGFDRELAKKKPLEILVVDDSNVNVSVCRRILELYGYVDVDAASDGIQAVDAAEKKRYDLILLDLQMPVLDGFGALTRIQRSPLAGEPCCVSLSANVDKATQLRCLEAGFFSVLNKPVDIPRLGEILNQVYDLRNPAIDN